jgi:hypothetical protein
MTYQTEVKSIIALIKEAVSLALNEPEITVSVEIKELTKKGQDYEIIGNFKVQPLFIKRTGKVKVTLNQSEKGLEIINLKIEEKEEGL